MLNCVFQARCYGTEHHGTESWSEQEITGALAQLADDDASSRREHTSITTRGINPCIPSHTLTSPISWVQSNLETTTTRFLAYENLNNSEM